jgi:hypothetical protein
LPSVFSVGPGVRITYGTGNSTATAIAATVATLAMASVRERRDMIGRLRAADTTHSCKVPQRGRRFVVGSQAGTGSRMKSRSSASRFGVADPVSRKLLAAALASTALRTRSKVSGNDLRY